MIDTTAYTHIRLEPAAADGAGTMAPDTYFSLRTPLDLKYVGGFAAQRGIDSMKRNVTHRNTYQGVR